MTAAKRRGAKPVTVTVEQPARRPRSAIISGPVRVIQPAIRATGSPWQYDHRLHGYMIPRDRVDDVAAAIELAGHRVDMVMPGWS